MAICTNGKKLLAIFERVESSKETGVQLMDLSGNIIRKLGTFFPWDVRRACVMDDSNIYLAIVNQASNNHQLVIGKYDISDSKGKILCEIPASENGKEPDGWNKGDWTADVLGLTLVGRWLYVPVFYDDKLYVIDTESGIIVSTTKISSPRGVAAFNGKVYLLSGKTLVRLDPNQKPGATIIRSGLDDPRGLAVDGVGNFYISDQGASQQVKEFTPGGRLLREIGLKGGRPRSGVYNAAGLLDPRGLCITPDGCVWVMSANWDFQELSVWGLNGNRTRTFFNSGLNSGQGKLTPDHKEMLFSTDPTGISAYRVDFEKNTWAPSWYLKVTKAMVAQTNVMATIAGYPSKAFDGIHPYLGVEGGEVLAGNGKTYMFGGDFSLWIVDPETKVPKLASLVYPHHVVKQPNGHYVGQWDQGPPDWLTWSDQNGDGKMSTDEIDFVENPISLAHVSKLINPQLQEDLSIYFMAPVSFKGNPYVADEWWIYRLPARTILLSGVPVYDWNELQHVVKLAPPDYKGGEAGGYKDPDHVNLDWLKIANNAAYVCESAKTKTKLRMTGIDGDGWWASRNWRMSTVKFDLKTGEPAWVKLGRRTSGRAKPGEMYYPGWGLSGTSRGVDFYTDTLSQVWAWTDDGLFLGGLYNDNNGLINPLFDANSLYIELIGAYIYEINGKTYIMAGDHGVSVHEVEMPPLTPLRDVAVTLSAAQSASAQRWDPDGPAPGKRPTYICRSIYDFDPAVTKNPRKITIDGRINPFEWSGVPEMALNLDGRQIGTVQMTFDKTNLYIAYRVQDLNGLKNDGHELPLAPFVTGSYVDFDLGPNWSSPNRDKSLDGDVRVIMARITGSSPTNYQMGFWPVRKDLSHFNPKPKRLFPQEIVSPAQQRNFDDIEPVPGLSFAWQTTGSGYTLEAAVPFASLGINPARQPIVGFDAGVAFADAAGQVRIRALHWAGETETAVVDRPGSAELKPQTWGTLEFDRSPLPPVITPR
jgi:hypothetical protein